MKGNGKEKEREKRKKNNTHTVLFVAQLRTSLHHFFIASELPSKVLGSMMTMATNKSKMS